MGKPALECKWWGLEGPRRLRELFPQKRHRDGDGRQRELAAQLATNPNAIWAWKVGFRRPGRDYRIALERILGIPVDAWLTPEELGKAKRLRAA